MNIYILTTALIHRKLLSKFNLKCRFAGCSRPNQLICMIGINTIRNQQKYPRHREIPQLMVMNSCVAKTSIIFKVGMKS